MIFFGDMAVGNKVEVDFPFGMSNKAKIINLEGALVRDVDRHIPFRRVVNNFDYVSDYIKKHDNVYFSLCNNHILDNGDFNETIENLDSLGANYFGAGINIESASKPLIIDDVVLLNFGWGVIECHPASKDNPGVNFLDDSYVMREFKKYQSLYPDKKIIIFFHWDYELEKYPMPNQRKLAFDLIDNGCECIVGAHSHRVQGVEIYKEKAIVYSLGNWIFQQGFFISGRLSFPDFCNLQLAFEYNKDGNHLLHYFEYNKVKHKVRHIISTNVGSSNINNILTPFSGMSFEEYDVWFFNHRYHKKLIPVYYSSDSKFIIKSKDIFNSLRTTMIKLLVKFRMKL